MPGLRSSAMAISLAVLITALLTGCAIQPEGDRRASELITSLSKRFGAELAPPRINTRDAEYLVAVILPSYRSEPGAEPSIDVAPLSWNGSTGSGDGAQIEARFHVVIRAHSAVSIGDQSYEAGSATRCFHYSAIGYRLYDTLAMREMACPGGEPPAMPTPSALPALPDDADARLTEVLTSTTVATVEADLRRAFPQKFIHIDSTSITTGPKTGELVVAVGVPDQFDCIVAVLGVTGVTILSSFDRIQLMPGETGCTTQLYVNPAK